VTAGAEGDRAAALAGIRVCDLSGQLAGAGATRYLAAFGPRSSGRGPDEQGWLDIVRGAPPFVDDRRGIDLGGGFNNHNVGKWGVTLNLRTDEGKEMLAALIRTSDVVTENFAPVCSPAWDSPTTFSASCGQTSSTSPTAALAERPETRLQDMGPDRAGVLRPHVRCRAGRSRAGWLGLLVYDHMGANYMRWRCWRPSSIATGRARASGSISRAPRQAPP